MYRIFVLLCFKCTDRILNPFVKNTGLETEIFNTTNSSFEALCLNVFRWQYAQVPVYRRFCTLLNRTPDNVLLIEQIPFLPIRFFRSHPVTCGNPDDAVVVFGSSGTSGAEQSRHYVQDPAIYETSFLNQFRLIYGDPADFCILGLLPGYLERTDSSLIYMVNRLIQVSGQPDSGFYLNDFKGLHEILQKNEAAGIKTLLIGVTFALLDFAAAWPIRLQHTVVMETGGMKGRKKELTREEVQDQLKLGFQTNRIHSEYGMTELLSQAYSTGDGRFTPAPWMRLLLREEDDPLLLHKKSSGTGAVNIIDLANLYSCSFIATDDRGRLHEDGRMEILGRLDQATLRGCSLLYT